MTDDKRFVSCCGGCNECIIYASKCVQNITDQLSDEMCDIALDELRRLICRIKNQPTDCLPASKAVWTYLTHTIPRFARRCMIIMHKLTDKPFIFAMKEYISKHHDCVVIAGEYKQIENGSTNFASYLLSLVGPLITTNGVDCIDETIHGSYRTRVLLVGSAMKQICISMVDAITVCYLQYDMHKTVHKYIADHCEELD